MLDENLSELFKTQKSLPEWLIEIKHGKAGALRREDGEKYTRLKILNTVIGLPFGAPTKFAAHELKDMNSIFKNFLAERGSELCAIRLIPTEEGLPKLRTRGKTIADAFQWFLEQKVDPTKYDVFFVPHETDNIWATIFVVNAHGIQGEIVKGGAHQLTQGFHDTARPNIFLYDFKTWSMSPEDSAALAYMKQTVALLKVPDKKKQQKLERELGATFVQDYLAGYFETTHSSVLGTWYIDYSQILGELYADMAINLTPSKDKTALTGRTGCSGVATGPVKIVQADNMSIDFPKGAILVCKVTTPAYIPLMERAAAIVTDQGGILSHAAIVARELKKPCIVGVGIATEQLKDGQTVTVDADKGIVTEANQ